METNKRGATPGSSTPEVAEIEINPVRVNADGDMALDVLVVLEQDKT